MKCHGGRSGGDDLHKTHPGMMPLGLGCSGTSPEPRPEPQRSLYRLPRGATIRVRTGQGTVLWQATSGLMAASAVEALAVTEWAPDGLHAFGRRGPLAMRHLGFNCSGVMVWK